MPSIADRIRWVIESRKVKNGSVWCLNAGLPRTYLSRYFHQARHGEPSDMGVQTCASLAAAADVSPAWLAYGIGAPEDAAATLPPNLKSLIARLPKNTYPAKLIEQAALVRDIVDEKDLPAEVWVDYLDGLRREARRIALELATARIESRGLKR